jgi:hypothetical protein
MRNAIYISGPKRKLIFFQFAMRLPHSRLFNIIISIRRVAIFFGLTFSSYVDAYIIIFVICRQFNPLHKELSDFVIKIDVIGNSGESLYNESSL